MTIEELLSIPSLDSLTDAQLTSLLQPYFPHTRPVSMTTPTEDIAKKFSQLAGLDDAFPEPPKRVLVFKKKPSA